jgi:hypothetical protein
VAHAEARTGIGRGGGERGGREGEDARGGEGERWTEGGAGGAEDWMHDVERRQKSSRPRAGSLRWHDQREGGSGKRDCAGRG